MTSTDPVPRSRGGGYALESLLSRSVIHEKAGAVIPRDLLRFGLYGSIVCIATGLLALLFPTADSIRHGDFFLILATPAADLQSVMHAAAIPLIVCGVALLALDPYLMQGRRSEHWRSAVVAQAATGAVGGAVGTVFLALVIINLVLWIVIAAFCLTMLCGLIASRAGGG
jgi:hypothetical protein